MRSGSPSAPSSGIHSLDAVSLATWTAAFLLASSMFAHTVALRLVLLFGGALCALVALARHRPSLHALPAIWLPFVLWGAWAALSVLWSQEPPRSLKEVHNEVGYTAVALWLCYVAGQAPRAALVVLPVLGAAATLLCGVAVHFFLFSPDPFAEGWHGGPGHLSSTLLMAMPVVAATGWYAMRHHRSRIVVGLSAALAALLLLAAYTTLNRTIWVGFIVELGLMIMVLSRASGAMKGKTLLGLAAVLVAGVAMAIVVHDERESGATARPLEKDPRIALWAEALDHIRERPWTGFGFGRGLLRDELRQETGDPQLWHSHNLFLDAMLQTGIPGLALLLVLLGATFRQGWRLSRDADDAAAAAGAALMALVCGMVIRNMTDLLFLRHNSLFYWGCVGLLLGFGRVSRLGRAA